MGDCKHSGVSELLRDHLLDGFLSYNVDVGGGLVKNDKLVAAKDGPDNADELALTDRQVLAFLLHLELQTLAIIFILLLFLFLIILVFIFFVILLFLIFGFLIRVRLRLACGGILLLLLFLLFLFLFLIFELLLGSALEQVLKTSFLDQFKNTLILVLVKRVEVEAKGTGEEGWVLRDHSNLISERFKVNPTDVLTINLNLSFFELDDAGEGHEECGLSSASSANYTDFLAGIDLEADTI